jgi:hypothetical protein
MPWKQCSVMDERAAVCGSPASRLVDGGTVQAIWASIAALRCSVSLQQKGMRANHKRVYCVYRESAIPTGNTAQFLSLAAKASVNL